MKKKPRGKLDVMLRKKIVVASEVMLLLKYMSEDEIEDITDQMLCFGLSTLDCRTLIDMVHENGCIEGWCEGRGREKIGNH